MGAGGNDIGHAPAQTICREPPRGRHCPASFVARHHARHLLSPGIVIRFMKTYQTAWELIITRLSGRQTVESIAAWERTLNAVVEMIDPATTFRALVDIRGYEVAEQDREVHMQQRVVIPMWLARHGLTVGFFGLYEIENTIVPSDQAPVCVQVAHVHHDKHKIDRYNELLASERERFFVDRDEALAWLATPTR
jgi:hypothetical protein